jgi:hypothetical protein
MHTKQDRPSTYGSIQWTGPSADGRFFVSVTQMSGKFLNQFVEPIQIDLPQLFGTNQLHQAA